MTEHKRINVLSLFDGCSGGQQALERANIKVNQYFASEIDKHAIKVTMANYPDTIQLGSVVDVDVSKLPHIDMLLGGSPCQSFSFAGKRKGMSTKDEQEILTLDHYLKLKSEGFEFEGQSYLFWEYMRILTDIRKYNPDVKFLLENVMMGEKWEKVLSRAIGVNPIEINSALVSAQNRRRLYWTNIGLKPQGLFGDLQSVIQQPKDRGILLKDILEDDVDEKYYLSEKAIKSIIQNENNLQKSTINPEKSNTLQPPGHACGIYKGASYVYGNKRLDETIEMFKDELEHHTLIDSYNKQIHKDKSITISTRVRESNCTHIVHNMQKRSRDRPALLKNPNAGGSGHLTRTDGKTYCLDTQNTNAVEIFDCYNNNFRKDGKVGTITQHMSRDGMTNGFKLVSSTKIRRLTPIECERLQTVKDNYTNYVSDSQRYRMLGNGWTIEVIAHILSYYE